MKAILKFPNEYFQGNLFWSIPYIYPKFDLDDGIEKLRTKNYALKLFEEGDGITFNSPKQDGDTVLNDFRTAFPWMNISISPCETAIDADKELFDEQIIILPIDRLEIDESINTEQISIYPAGMFGTKHINYSTLDEEFYKNSERKSLRDHITNSTPVNKDVFNNFPLVVIRDKVTEKEYFNMNQIQDNHFIKKYSNKAEEILDIIRFEHCEYTVPDGLLSKAGVFNDRHSVALVYFPKYRKGFFQCREVEIKALSKGIGVKIYDVDAIQYHRLLILPLGETGKITKHALRLNSLIQESDNETIKFIQIMNLLEFIGDPFKFEKFQDIKGKFIAIVAKDNEEYQALGVRFHELTGGLNTKPKVGENGLRTSLVHEGQIIEDRIPKHEDRKKLFKELEGYIIKNIRFMIDNASLSWEDFDNLRKQKIQIVIRK